MGRAPKPAHGAIWRDFRKFRDNSFSLRRRGRARPRRPRRRKAERAASTSGDAERGVFRRVGKRMNKEHGAASRSERIATESGAPLAATRQAASALGRDDHTKAIEFDRGHVGSRRDASERLHASDAFGRRRFLSDASIVLNRIGCSMIKMPRGQGHRPPRPAGSTARRTVRRTIREAARPQDA
jgi:hypothetical protein